MSAGVETAACTTAVEILRCECGAHMQWTGRGKMPPSGQWQNQHRCLRAECAKEEWLDKVFPRLLVFDDVGWGSKDPIFTLNPTRVGYE